MNREARYIWKRVEGHDRALRVLEVARMLAHSSPSAPLLGALAWAREHAHNAWKRLPPHVRAQVQDPELDYCPAPLPREASAGVYDFHTGELVAMDSRLLRRRVSA